MKLPEDFVPGDENIEVIELPTTINWIEDGILFFHTKPDLDHTLDLAKEHQEVIGKLSKGERTPILADARQARPLDVETRKYYATAEGTKYAIAFAFLVKSSFSKVLANIFIKLQKLHVPTKMFTSKEEAVKWLKQQ